MSEPKDISEWVQKLKEGDDDAASHLWETYFERLVRLAQRRLPSSLRRSRDEEDVALSAFHSFVKGVKEDVVEDVLRLMSMFAATTLSGAFKLQLEIVNHDMCRLFHQDYYRQRLICTLKGPGTEWLDHDNVNRGALGKGDNDAIVKDMDKVHRANTHDVLLLKGAKYGGGTPSVIHRSPPIAHQKGLRVLLKLDE